LSPKARTSATNQTPEKSFSAVSLAWSSMFLLLLAYLFLLSSSSACMVQLRMVPSRPRCATVLGRSMVCPAQHLVSERRQNWVLWRV